MAATWMALWLALAPTATPSPAPRPPLPERRGAAVVGVAIGVQVLGAAGTFASSWALDRRCTTSGRTDLAASVQCMADHAARRPVMYLGMLASRGTIALSAVGGDQAGTHDGAHDAWALRPRRGDLRRLRVAGGVVLGAGAALLVASTIDQWVVLPRCRAQATWEAFDRCVELALYLGWAADVTAGISMATGAGLLTYASGYANAHRAATARRRGLALSVAPRLTTHELGLAARLSF